ncbi:MFS transporter, partial [Klenkia sp. PcliD-1-E]|uniref:MFS transporter n=1 Tax=Klenkia sp. PcliD-1-E TaxID=2954492 RepID=UPI0020979F60
PEPTAPPSPGLGARPPKVTVTRVAAQRSRELTVAAVRRVNAASRADGAGDSGLAHVLWVNALHTAGDAMVAVSLAGTLFFAASTDAQRGNVALYLLVTMAPFAVVAPLLGPLLDRLQRGRRWAMAASLVGRAVLALVMAANFDGFWLYPAALGALVLSKAHNVLRAAVIPRVVPPAMSLTSANARTSVFGLVTAGVFGGIGAGIAASAGFPPLLWATAAVFTAAGVLALRLPGHVDVPAGEVASDLLTTTMEIPVPGHRGRPRVAATVVDALRSAALLRVLGGFLTIYAAFLVQAAVPGGWERTLALGAIAGAAGVGSFLGTAIGSRLHRATPDTLVLWSTLVAVVAAVAAALLFSVAMVAVTAGVAALAAGLGKVSLDAIIQRDVPGAQHASAFARSETLLQLAWVLGGGLGIALPADLPVLAFGTTAGLLVVATGLVAWLGHHRRPARGRGRTTGWERA